MALQHIRGISNKNIRWLGALENAHKGEVGFLIGNGWSANFYDIPKLKQWGILIGCNEAHKTDPIDYLLWQDSNVSMECCRAKECIKIAPFKLVRKKSHQVDTETTYFYNTGNGQPPFGNGKLPHGNTGYKAFALARMLGLATLFLVGCDCRVFQDKETEEYHANRFKDKQANRVKRTTGGRAVEKANLTFKGRNGWFSTSLLKNFAGMFQNAYDLHKNHMRIFHLGDFAIHSIPALIFRNFGRICTLERREIT